MVTKAISSANKIVRKPATAQKEAPDSTPPSFLKLGVGEALAQEAGSTGTASTINALRDQWSLHSRLEVQRLLRQLARVRNVDAAEPNGKKRAQQFVEIVRDALTTLDGSVEDQRLTFLVRTGWHEGKDLTARTQYPRGPGRGFLQMEPKAAFDGIERAAQKSWLATLSAAATITEKQLMEAAAPLKDGPPWPAGNLVDESLRSYDLFAVLMARAYLSRVSVPIPDDLSQQSDYWEDHWHRVSDATKKAKWLSDARRLNKLLEWS